MSMSIWVYVNVNVNVNVGPRPIKTVIFKDERRYISWCQFLIDGSPLYMYMYRGII